MKAHAFERTTSADVILSVLHLPAYPPVTHWEIYAILYPMDFFARGYEKEPCFRLFPLYRKDLFEDAVEVHIVQNLLLNEAIVDEFLGLEPDSDFTLGFLRTIGAMNEVPHCTIVDR